MNLAAHMNMVNDTRIAEADARLKAKQMSGMAKQRAKELALHGQSCIAPIRIRNNPKWGEVRARSIASPSKAQQKRGIFSAKISTSIEEVSKMMNNDSIANLNDAIEKVRACLKVMKEKRDLNLELAKERFLSNSNDSRTTELSNRIGKYNCVKVFSLSFSNVRPLQSFLQEKLFLLLVEQLRLLQWIVFILFMQELYKWKMY